MESSKLQLISTKLIKPSFSTPPSLTTYKLGLVDQLLNNVYIPIAFFYPNNSSSFINISTLLENSLSKVLGSYYPLAGKEVDNLNIDCTEMGATLIEANVNCKMSQILRQPNVNAQDIIFPSGLNWRYKPDQSLIVAQITHFACGGKAISLCMSHKVSDAQTLCNFARDWAAVTKQTAGDHQNSSSPQLNGASLVPPIEDPSMKPEFGLFPEQRNCITKRFVFKSSKINELKAIFSDDTGITNPTRVEVVTALLHKCAYEAALKMYPNSHKIPIFVQVVNMRPFFNPPLSSNFVGNLANYFGVPLPDDKCLPFTRLVSELRGAKQGFCDKFKGISAQEFRKEILKSVEYMKVISDGESKLDQYICTSMCRFPFYDMDFGWGKPERVSFAAAPFKNFIILMDDINGDGVEAFVPLEDKVMNVFERDTELLTFASLG
nr:BAHD acyltransferase [Symphytum officinale]